MYKHTAMTIRRGLVHIAAGIGFVIGAGSCAAATSAGSLDPTFGTGGKKIFNLVPGPDDDISWGVVQPDGKLVAAGYVQRNAAGNGSLPVVRFLDNGEPDPSFGIGGVTTLDIDESAYAGSWGAALGAGGRIYVAGSAQSSGNGRCLVVALRANGTLDPAFANGGVFRYPAAGAASDECTNIVVQADGKLAVLGNRDGFRTNYVLRMMPDGTLDATFGNGGVAEIPPIGKPDYLYGLSVSATGQVYVAGGPSSNEPAVIWRLTGAGQPDAAFGTGGKYTLPQSNSFLYAIKALPDGSAIASGLRGSKHLVVKLDAAGNPDAGFGTGGFVEFTLGNGYVVAALELQRDGKVVLGVRVTGSGTYRFAVARLNANGTFDATYGTGGITQIDIGTPREVLYGIAQAPDGKIWAFGRADVSDNETAVALARFLPDEITTTVVEFHNTILAHYFITADPNEAAAIDGGSAGPGWVRTGQSFKSGGPNKAGRFYGNPDTNPATGARYGPNSHFYSLDPNEISQVKLDPGWRFESYDFNAWPKAGGACPAGTQAVLRVYNGRFAQNDSNHRYTVLQAIYDQMLAQGWSGEGSVFCAPL